MITTHECRNEVKRMANFPYKLSFPVRLFLYILLFRQFEIQVKKNWHFIGWLKNFFCIWFRTSRILGGWNQEGEARRMNFSVCLFVWFFFQERCFSSCVGQGKYLQILRSDALQFRGIILWWHRPAEALDVRKKTWCTRKICVNNLRFFHVTYGNTYRYRYTKRHITASRLLSATLVVMTRIRKILDEKTAFFVHVSLGAILCDFLKSMLRVFSLGSMKEDFIILWYQAFSVFCRGRAMVWQHKNLQIEEKRKPLKEVI